MDQTISLPTELPGPDREAEAAVLDRASRVLRPRGALARLDAIAGWLASWQRTERPSAAAPAVVVFVADHGVAARGVSAYPQEVTAEVLKALESGVATASVMARAIGATLSIVDVGVGEPTEDLSSADAMSPERFAACFQSGRDSLSGIDPDLLVLGEMGIGNTTAAAAVAAALFGLDVNDWVGRGTGIDDRTLERKREAVEAARSRVEGDDPLEVLRRAGGAELAALAGAALEARMRSIPIVLDGFVVTAAVAPLAAERPGALDHCIAGHCSAEPGHRLLLDKLGLEPLLDLGLRLGEGSGALAAVPLIRLAAAAVIDVATFDEWGLSR